MGDVSNTQNHVRDVGSSSIQCPILTSTNYTVWSMRMKVMMQGEKIWETIEPASSKVEKNDIATTLLFQTVEEPKMVKRFLQSLPQNKYIQIIASLEQVLDLNKIIFEDIIGQLKAYKKRILDKVSSDETHRNFLFLKTESHNKISEETRGTETDDKRFMDVLLVTNQFGNKITHGGLILYIQQAICYNRSGGTTDLDKVDVEIKKKSLRELTGSKSPKDVQDTHGLAMNAYCSDDASSHVHHLGLHIALCILMGWNFSKMVKEFEILKTKLSRVSGNRVGDSNLESDNNVEIRNLNDSRVIEGCVMRGASSLLKLNQDFSDKENNPQEENETDKEDEEHGYYDREFVCKKIKNYPWWPVQIYEPSYVFDMALKMEHKGKFLVAYFEDFPFAWCGSSQFKSFVESFKDCSKISNSRSFLCAVKKADVAAKAIVSFSELMHGDDREESIDHEEDKRLLEKKWMFVLEKQKKRLKGATVSKPASVEDSFKLKVMKTMGAMEEGDTVFGSNAKMRFEAELKDGNEKVKQDLRKIWLFSKEFLETTSVALTKAEEAKEVTKVSYENIELLRKEIADVNDSVEHTKVSCTQDQKEQFEIFAEQEIQQQSYKAGMEESANKLLALKNEFDPEFVKKLEVHLTETYNNIDLLQKQMENAKTSDMDSANGVSLKLNEVKGVHEKFVEEEKSLQELVESLKEELKNVKMEHSEAKAKELTKEAQTVCLALEDAELNLRAALNEVEKAKTVETKALEQTKSMYEKHNTSRNSTSFKSESQIIILSQKELQFVLFYADVGARGSMAEQEYFIKKKKWCALETDVQREKLRHCLVVARSRRASRGLIFEMKSNQEVVKEMKQIAEDNQQLNWFKNKHAKVPKGSLKIMSEKLSKTVEDIHIVRQRTKMQHEQNSEEMNSQDKFFNESLNQIRENRDAKEEKFEMLQQQKYAKIVEQQEKKTNPSSNDGLLITRANINAQGKTAVGLFYVEDVNGNESESDESSDEDSSDTEISVQNVELDEEELKKFKEMIKLKKKDKRALVMNLMINYEEKTKREVKLMCDLSHLMQRLMKKVVICTENQSTISLNKNPVFHRRSKHIHTKYHFIRECVENGQIEVEHILGNQQKAGILTKTFGRIKLKEMRDLIGVQDLEEKDFKLKGENDEISLKVT